MLKACGCWFRKWFWLVSVLLGSGDAGGGGGNGSGVNNVGC